MLLLAKVHQKLFGSQVPCGPDGGAYNISQIT